MKTVLISGGAGFIGSHLVKHFIDQGDFVVVVDNLYTGKKENIFQHLASGRFLFLRKDISLCTINDFIQFKFDYVLHFASPASPIHYMKQPFMTMNANSKGTEFMLEIASRDNARFLLASTSEVYGDPTIHPQFESYYGNVNSFGERSCYDESKRFAEALTYTYFKHKKSDVRIARFFNTYGPYMCKDDGRAVPAFINQALKNEPITVFGDGLQTRSLCYIDDCVEGIVKLLTSEITEPYIHSPINIGNPEEVTMLELAQLIKLLCNSDSEIIFQELPQDDPKRRRPDISKVKTLLNWEPKVSLEKGLIETIEYFKGEVKYG
jgi:nucleoside-diphosphate-sugar epimerase